MSENFLHYALYFQSRTQARRRVEEAEATAGLPSPAQSLALEALLGLPEGSGVSFEVAGAPGCWPYLAA